MNLNLEYETMKISQFVDDMKNGGTPRRNVSEYWENGTIPWLKTGEINNSPILNNSEYITEEGLKNSSAKLLPINSVIMALYGKGTAGRVGLLKFEATTNQACCAMICDDKNKSEYLYYYLLAMQPQIELLANGSVQQNLSKDILADYEINVPKNYQDLRNIVWILNNIDQKIENNKSIIKNLEEIAKAIYRYHFIDLKPYALGCSIKPTPIGMVPTNWSVQTIREFVDDMKNGGTPKRGESDYWDNGTVPWLKTGEINNNIIIKSEEHITELGLKNSSAKLLPINSIIMALYGKGTAARIGLLKLEATTNQACCAMICNDFNKTLFLYLFLLFNQKEIENLASGSVQQNLSKDLIANLEIVAPPTEIIENLPFKEIFDKIANSYFEIEYLTNLRNTLLPKLMAGEIDISKINYDLNNSLIG